MTRFLKRYEYRDEYVPGYVYLIDGFNVTSIIPGKLVRRWTTFTIGGIVLKNTKFAQGFLPANNIEQIK